MDTIPKPPHPLAGVPFTLRGDPVALADLSRTLDAYQACKARLADLRAILEPLLNHPFDTGMHYVCHFCEMTEQHGHVSDCPVLRKDELLGRG